MKKGRIQINFSNRLLYTLIALGIVAILSVGVYASTYANSAGVGHDFTELKPCITTGQVLKYDAKSGWGCGSTTIPDPLRIGVLMTNEVTAGKSSGQVMFDVAANNIGADTSIYSYGKICVGNGAGDCSSTTTIGTLLTSSSVTSGSFIYSSDRALKTNIQPLTNSLDKVLQLNGVSFNWKSTGEKSIGLIAQDVEKILPELVSGTEGSKGIVYGNIVALLIEAVKEQQKQIDELKSQIQELKEN